MGAAVHRCQTSPSGNSSHVVFGLVDGDRDAVADAEADGFFVVGVGVGVGFFVVGVGVGVGFFVVGVGVGVGFFVVGVGVGVGVLVGVFVGVGVGVFVGVFDGDGERLGLGDDDLGLRVAFGGMAPGLPAFALLAPVDGVGAGKPAAGVLPLC
jgi:hypothetical protein